MRNNLQPYKQTARPHDSTATPKNIQVALYNSREQSREVSHVSRSKSPLNNTPGATPFMQRDNSDLLEQFPDTQVKSQEKQEESLNFSRTNDRKQKLNEMSPFVGQGTSVSPVGANETTTGRNATDHITSYVESSLDDIKGLNTN